MWHVSDVPGYVEGILLHWPAVEFDGSSCGLQKIYHLFDKCTLARAVVAQQSEYFALNDIEANAVIGRNVRTRVEFRE